MVQGEHFRDWLYVRDHNSAVWKVITHGRIGESYSIGGDNEWENVHLVETLCDIVADAIGVPTSEMRDLTTYVTDRPGHDRRYAIGCSKLKDELGWSQSVTFDEGLRRTVRWYLDNKEWTERVRSGKYRAWIEKNYVNT